MAIWLTSANPVSSKVLFPWLKLELSVQVGESEPLYRTAQLRVPYSRTLSAVLLSIFRKANDERFVSVGSQKIENVTWWLALITQSSLPA